MKRTVITMDGNGEFSIPSNLQDLWMIEGELVDMLHVTAPKLHAVIRSMYKEGLFLVSDVQQKKETSKGIWQTQYGFPMIVALCFRINSYGAARFRATIFKRLYGALSYNSIEEQPPLVECPLVVGLMLSFCHEEVQKHWYEAAYLMGIVLSH